MPEDEANAPKKKLSNLAVRLATAVVGLPILFWMLFSAPPVVFSLSGFLFSGIAASELATMTLKGERLLQAWMVVASLLVTGVMIFIPEAEYLLTLIFGLLMAGPLLTLVRPDPLERAAAKMAWLIAGPIYVGGAVAAIGMLHHLENGGAWVVLSMALAWASDTGGYFAGRAFGKHKLYEKISPKKTVEGSIGGLVVIVIFSVLASAFWMDDLSYVHAVVLALVGGAIGQMGDLCVSAIKRSTNVKDSGKIIPGHGGLLDRIDALMFTSAVTLLYAHWVLELPRTIPYV